MDRYSQHPNPTMAEMFRDSAWNVHSTAKIFVKINTKHCDFVLDEVPVIVCPAGVEHRLYQPLGEAPRVQLRNPDGGVEEFFGRWVKKPTKEND